MICSAMNRDFHFVRIFACGLSSKTEAFPVLRPIHLTVPCRSEPRQPDKRFFILFSNEALLA